MHGTFDSISTVATVGASYAAKKLRTSSGEFVFQCDSELVDLGRAWQAPAEDSHLGSLLTCRLWDTAGAERFDSLSRLYYSGAQAALVCVDPTDSSSFSKTQFWVSATASCMDTCSKSQSLETAKQLSKGRAHRHSI